MTPTFKCSACNGRLALWAVRAEFVCPHCDMILRSNRGRAIVKAAWVTLAVEALLFSGLYLQIDSLGKMIAIWGSLGGVLGYWAGWVAIKRFMVLQAVRRKPVAGATHG